MLRLAAASNAEFQQALFQQQHGGALVHDSETGFPMDHPGRDQKLSLSYLSTNYRRDLVWRPLIRLLRRWLKKDALSIEMYDGIREEPVTRQGLLFC